MHNGVFQRENNLKKGITQHASRHNVNRPAQNLKKKHQNFIYSKEQISILARKFLDDCLSQYRVDCASENCLSHR